MMTKHVITTTLSKPMAGLAAGLVGLTLIQPAVAQSEIVPTAKRAQVNWSSVAREFSAPPAAAASRSNNLSAAKRSTTEKLFEQFAVENTQTKDALRPLASLNAVTSGAYPGVQSVPVPVLAPVDVRRSQGSLKDAVAPSILSASTSRMQLIAKSSGYDAILTISPELLRAKGVANAKLVQIHLGGSALEYEIPGTSSKPDSAPSTQLVDDNELRARFPQLRRQVGRDDVSYSFTKYNVRYFASMPCQRKLPREPGIISCDRADAILRPVMLDLRVMGGAPLPLKRRTVRTAPPRPTKISSTFKYHPPGDLIPGTSQDGLGGTKTRILWGPADFVFPIKDAPAFANSQLFMHSGNCLSSRGTTDKMVPLPRDPKIPHDRYHCKQNQIPLFKWEGHPANYSYPWRDTYCEVRNDGGRQPKDCPAKERAHEGQDIRPSTCKMTGGRCEINRFDVVAVTKGEAWWTSTNHVRLISTDETNLYYMYMHMDPDSIKRAGLVQGEKKSVVAGQKIGEVGNWWKTDPDGTTTHLHFEIRKKKKIEQCGQFGCTVSPYWTLIRAYERLIGEQGVEVK